mmetsp:Transcript_18733/g.51616  ORF Transcript_18733/g.51616 Transcript_18733/m.51616 type:complete len:220 (-) Transcript_18733:150-809(-)
MVDLFTRTESPDVLRRAFTLPVDDLLARGECHTALKLLVVLVWVRVPVRAPLMGLKLFVSMCDGILVPLILVDVPLKEAREWAQDAKEGLPRDVEACAGANGIDAGLPRLATEQRDLAKVIPPRIVHDLHLTLFAPDAGHSLAGLQDEHLVVTLALLQHSLVILKLLLLQDLGQHCTLVPVEHLQHVHTVEELHSRLELCLGTRDNQVPEGRTVKGPNF